MVNTILVFSLVAFDSSLILNLVMPKIILFPWCGVILKVLWKFQSIVYRPTGTGAKLKGCFYEWQIYEILRENIYLLKNIANILIILQYLLPYQT